MVAAERPFVPNSFGGDRSAQADLAAERPLAPNSFGVRMAIRPAQAADAAAMSALVEQFAAQNLMLPRSAAQILRALPDFLVAVEITVGPDGAGERVVGCGSLAALAADLAEVRSLAVDASQHGNGLGGLLVGKLLDLALARGFRQVCALTLRPRFFERLGFEAVDRWSISPKVWQECIYCPKFHRCDEVAMLLTLPEIAAAPVITAPAARNGLLKRLILAPVNVKFF
ncbi:MAG: GNAT family N-acetyltransferase [Anaerolineae bacterium]